MSEARRLNVPFHCKCKIYFFLVWIAYSRQLDTYLITGIFHQIGKVLRLHENSIKIRISQSDALLDRVWICQLDICFEFRPRLSDDEVLSIRSWHFHSRPQ